jgi:hypothetical protein
MRRTTNISGLVCLVSVGLSVACGSPSNRKDGRGPTTAGGAGGASSAGSSQGGNANAQGGSVSAEGGSVSSGGTSASSGGTETAGGSGVVIDPPPMVIADCDSLGEVGVWEQVAPADAGPPTSLAVDPVNSGTVYFGTSNGLNKGGTMGVWKSTNCGSTWTHINTGTDSGGCSVGPQQCSSVVDMGRIWSFGIDYVNPQNLYVNNGYGEGDLGLMKSSDGGVNWFQVWPQCSNSADCFNSKNDPENAEVNSLAPGFLGDVVVDPYNPEHILTTFHASCKNVEVCFGESLDGGATWNIVDGNPAMGSAHESRLGFLDSSETWAFISGGIWVSRNSGADWEKKSDGGGGGMYYKASNGAYYVGGGDAIFRSTDVGETWSSLPDTGPFIQGLVGDGETIYASKFAVGFDWGDNLQPYIKTNEAEGTSWEAYESPGFNQGAIQSGIDTGHNLMFSAHSEDGFWRVKIK